MDRKWPRRSRPEFLDTAGTMKVQRHHRHSPNATRLFGRRVLRSSGRRTLGNGWPCRPLAPSEGSLLQAFEDFHFDLSSVVLEPRQRVVDRKVEGARCPHGDNQGAERSDGETSRLARAGGRSADLPDECAVGSVGDDSRFGTYMGDAVDHAPRSCSSCSLSDEENLHELARGKHSLDHVLEGFWMPKARQRKGAPVEGAKLPRFDPARAGIPYIDDAYEVAEFYALRHTFVTRAAGSEAGLDSPMKAARHSDPKVTGRNLHAGLEPGLRVLEAMDPPCTKEGEEPAQPEVPAPSDGGPAVRVDPHETISGLVNAGQDEPTRDEGKCMKAPRGRKRGSPCCFPISRFSTLAVRRSACVARNPGSILRSFPLGRRAKTERSQLVT